MEDIRDKDGRELKVGTVVKVEGWDFDQGVVVGFDDGKVDVVELHNGWTLDSNDLEAVGKIG